MLQRCTTLVVAAAVALVAAGCGQTDAGITTTVKTKFAADDTVRAYQVNVDTRNGVVTLRGDVDTMAAKEQAVRIARGTDGVRDVIDQITVADTAATGGFLDPDFSAAAADAAITSAVKAKLLADRTVQGLTIDVDTKAGVVALNGTVASRAEADRAVALARDTEGVDHVVNNLRTGR